MDQLINQLITICPDTSNLIPCYRYAKFSLFPSAATSGGVQPGCCSGVHSEEGAEDQPQGQLQHSQRFPQVRVYTSRAAGTRVSPFPEAIGSLPGHSSCTMEKIGSCMEMRLPWLQELLQHLWLSML